MAIPTRNTNNSLIGGVCSGLADKFNMPVWAVRTGAVASLLLPGPQIVAYAIAWIVMPDGKTKAAAVVS